MGADTGCLGFPGLWVLGSVVRLGGSGAGSSAGSLVGFPSARQRENKTPPPKSVAPFGRRPVPAALPVRHPATPRILSLLPLHRIECGRRLQARGPVAPGGRPKQRPHTLAVRRPHARHPKHPTPGATGLIEKACLACARLAVLSPRASPAQHGHPRTSQRNATPANPFDFPCNPAPHHRVSCSPLIPSFRSSRGRLPCHPPADRSFHFTPPLRGSAADADVWRKSRTSSQCQRPPATVLASTPPPECSGPVGSSHPGSVVPAALLGLRSLAKRGPRDPVERQHHTPAGPSRRVPPAEVWPWR